MKAEIQKVIRVREPKGLYVRAAAPANVQQLLEGLKKLDVGILTVGGWKGHFPLPVFTGVTPLTKESVVPTISSLVEDRIVNWHSPEAAQETLDQTLSRRSPFARAITTMLDQPGGESKEGFGILNEDLRRFRPEAAIFKTSDDFEKWWVKFVFGTTAHTYINARAAFDHEEISPEARNLFDTVEAQMEIFKATLESFELEDLPSYLRFADLYALLGAVTKPGHFRSFGDRRQDALGKLLFPKIEEMERREIAFRNGLWDQDIRTWERLKIGWSWRQIQDVIAALPILGSRFVTSNAIAALYVNLKGLPSQEVDKVTKLNPNGFVPLLKLNPETVIRESRAEQNYPLLVEDFEEAVQLPQFSTPVKDRPLTAIALLNEAGKIFPPDDFRRLLTDIHRLVQPDQELTTPWLLTLLSLENNHPQIAEFVNDLAKWENLPPEVREILLNKVPGKLDLTRRGEIRILPETSSLVSKPEEACLKPEEIDDKTVESREILILPFLGEVGLIKEEKTESLLQGSNGIFTDEDGLLEDFTRLATIWRDTRGRERHLLYLSQLNPSSSPLQEARKLFGICTVYIRQNGFVFVLDEKRLNVQVDGRKLPVGFEGRLDETGQLHISGMDKSFLGEPEQLLLNNLALCLATQSFYAWGDQKRDPEVRRSAHGIIADWNRFQRNSLPKIDLPLDKTGKNGPCLPVGVADQDKPVLVCER